MSGAAQQHAPPVSFARACFAALVAILLATALTELFSSFGYWGSFVAQLLGFCAAGWLAARIARNRAPIAVSLGLGLTWGAVGIYGLLHGLAQDGEIRSAILVIVYVVAAVATAIVGGKWNR